jgi:magnesium chelatase family protein
VGGGPTPRPGEVTLAHRGVLFLDELGEFSRAALDALRQPLEEGRVEVTRGQRTVVYPARVLLLAACNPCPCGRGDLGCTCGAVELARYARRLNGPLLDRIDLVCNVEAVSAVELVRPDRRGAPSAVVRERATVARGRQRERLRGTGALCNGDMGAALTRRQVPLGELLRARLASVRDPAVLSGRGHDRLLRVARTIADLDGSESVQARHLDEALGYRLGNAGSAAA